MRTILLTIFASLPVLAADVTVSAIVPTQLFPSGGEIACNPAGTACVWSTAEYASANYSTSELAGCLGGYSGGLFQCTGPVTCLTCGLDMTLFGYMQQSPSVVTKGQPFFENTTGNYLMLWVSANETFSGSPACLAPTPGSGVCGDAWYMSISTSPLSLTNAHNITNISSANNGVLYARTGGGNIWMSYRFRGPLLGTPSCNLGGWEIRVWPYSIGGSFLLGSELAGSPFTPIGACSYSEMSGSYDPVSGEFTFQGVPTSTTFNFWQTNIYGFNLNYPTAFDLIVPWGTDGIHNAWDEHANTDKSHSYIVWSSSAGVTANNYDGSQGTFGNCGPGCTGSLPLDKWTAVLPRFTDAQGIIHLGQIGNAFRLTGVNLPGSPDRAMTCALDGAGCASGVVFSGGYADYTQPNTLAELIKDTSGNAAIYGISFLSFTTRLLGSAVLSGNAKLQ